MTPEQEARVRAIWSGAQKPPAPPRPIGALLQAIADSIAAQRAVKALALLLTVALSAPAWADPPADAPALTPRTVTLTEAEAVAAAKRVVSCEAERDVLRRGPPVGVVVLVAAVAVVVGGAVGAGVTYAATRPRP